MPASVVNQPLVTIAIPTYNRADSYLPHALQSALNQTYDSLDILVSDNCSGDDTEKVVRSLGGPRVRYFRHTVNIGAHANFMFCLEQARGNYFLLLQDDNLIDDDFIDACVRAADYRADVGLIRSGMRRIDSEGKIIGELSNYVDGLPLEKFLLGWFTNETPMHLCCTLFNTEMLRGIGGFESKHYLFDDVIAEIRMAAAGERVDFPDIKASFRSHTNTLTASAPISKWCEESKLLLETMCSLVPNSQVASFKRHALRFVIGHNYRIARKIGPLVTRLTAYATILRHFDYSFSLFSSIALAEQVQSLKISIKKALENRPGVRLKVETLVKACRAQW
jgi:glycosyltransferase involved in cell wall biosynthesis